MRSSWRGRGLKPLRSYLVTVTPYWNKEAPLLWSAFLNKKCFKWSQIKPYLHFVVAEGLQHFQADLLRFCWQQQGQVSYIIAVVTCTTVLCCILITYPVWCPETVFQQSEDSRPSGPWRSHWRLPFASSAVKMNKGFSMVTFKFLLSLFNKPVSSIQAGPSCSTWWPCFSCADSSGFLKPAESWKCLQ